MADYFKPQTKSVNMDLVGDLEDLQRLSQEFGEDSLVVSSGRRNPEKTLNLLEQRKQREGLNTYTDPNISSVINEVLLRGKNPNELTFPSGNWRPEAEKRLKDLAPEDYSTILDKAANIRKDFGGYESPHLRGQKLDVPVSAFINKYGPEEGKAKAQQYYEFLKKQGYDVIFEPKAGQHGVIDIRLKDKPSTPDERSGDMEKDFLKPEDLEMINEIEKVKSAPMISSANPEVKESALERYIKLQQEQQKRIEEAQKQQRMELGSLAFLRGGQRNNKGAQEALGKITDLTGQTAKDINQLQSDAFKNQYALEKDARTMGQEKAGSDLFKQYLQKKYPELQIPENIAPNYLKDLIGATKTTASSAFQQSDYMTSSGDPVHFDKTVGKYINTLTGKEVSNPGSLIRNYTKTAIHPITKELMEVRSGVGLIPLNNNSNIMTSTTDIQNTEPQQLKMESFKTKTPQEVYGALNPAEREQLNEFTTAFASETKDDRASLAKVDRVIDKAIEATQNPIAAAQLGAEVATIFENGRLTDEDVLRYTRRMGITDRLTDALKSIYDGTLNKEKAMLIQDTLRNFSRDSKRELGNRALEKAKLAASRTNLNLSPDDLAGLIYGDYEKRVKMQDPNGKIRLVPVNQVDAAINAGGKLAE